MFLLAAIVLCGQNFKTFGQAVAKFNCATFGMVVTHNQSPTTTQTTFSRITIEGGNVIDHPICTIPFNVNATAYNPADGFIYAFVIGSLNQLLRIDTLGNYDILNVLAPTGTVAGSAYKGACCNTNNFFYMTANGAADTRIYYVNLSAPNAQGNYQAYPMPLVVTAAGLGANGTGLPDIVWNPANNTIYGVEGRTTSPGSTPVPEDGRVVVIKLSADGKSVTSSTRLPSPHDITGTPTSNYSFAGVYINFDGSSNIGSMYGVSNDQNNQTIWNYNLSSGDRTQISKALTLSANDAASCPYLQSDISVSKNDGLIGLWPGQTAHYSVVVRNLGPVIIYNMNIRDSVPDGIVPANVQYTAAVTGGATTKVTGVKTGAINDTINISPGETVTYKVDLYVRPDYDTSLHGGLLVNKVHAIPDYLTIDPDMTNNYDYDADRIALPVLPVNPNVRIDIHK